MRKTQLIALKNSEKLINSWVSLLHKWLDFLTFQLIEDKEYFKYILNWEIKINNEIFIPEYFWKIWEREIYNIIDNRWINICQVRIRVEFKKQNKNMYSNIDFKWEFFYFYYKEFFVELCNLFRIDLNKRGILKRIDWCFDCINASVLDFEIKKGKKKNYFNIKNKENILESIKKMWFAEFEEDFELSWRKWKGEYYDLVIYNKRLDIYENHKKFEDIKQIYFWHYLYNYSAYITRIEYSKKAKWLYNKVNNSFYEVLECIEWEAIKWINRKLNLRFEKIVNYKFNFSNIKLETKEDIQTQWLLMKREKYYKTMFKAYLKKVLLPTSREVGESEIIWWNLTIKDLEARKEKKIADLINSTFENYYFIKI